VFASSCEFSRAFAAATAERGQLVTQLLCTFLAATADETHQMSIPGRTGRWHDVGLDLLAAILVLLLVRAHSRRCCRGTPNF